MTFRKQFPQKRIFLASTTDERNVTEDNWYKDRKKMKLVWGELRRIFWYWLKGDVKY